MYSGKLGFGSWSIFGLAGAAAGLAALAKLNGALATITLGGWAVLTMVLPRVSIARKLAVVSATLPAGLIAVATFTALNPFLTAQPRNLHPKP